MDTYPTHKASTPANHGAFTLIEVIITITIIGLILPLITLTLFTVMRQQIAVARTNEVKRQGDLALNTMKTLIQTSAETIYDVNDDPICNSPGGVETINQFRDSLGRRIQFYVTGSVLTYRYGQGTPANTISDITSDTIRISNLTLQCIRLSTYSFPLISIDFTATYNGATSTLDLNPSLNYSTKLILRKQ